MYLQNLLQFCRYLLFLAFLYPQILRKNQKYKEPVAPNINNLPALPEGWVWAKVEQLYEIVGGGTPSTNVPEYWNGNIPWITSADIYDVKDIRPRKQVTERGIENSATNLVPDKSIIVVTRVGLGKVALTKTPLCFSQDSQALINPSYLLFSGYSIYYLSKAVQVFKHEHRGTTIAGVTKKQLAELPFPIPPLYEQRKIVEEIERCLSVADGIDTASEANIIRAQRLRQSILQCAFRGDLNKEKTKHDREGVL
jgi:type I restriction enzyme S subunit